MSENYFACKVRVAVHADIESMVSLLGELFVMEQDFFPDAEAQKRGLQMILDDPSTARILVADAGGIVGMCVVHRRISTFYGAVATVLEDVIVKKEFRGRGIGRLLLNAAGQHSSQQGQKHLQLLMDSENSAAESFYLANGWKKTRLVCMRKNLEDSGG